MTPAFAVLEAERTVLGAVLVSPEIFASVTLVPEDFAIARHGTIWRALRGLDEAGRPLDLVTLKDELATRGDLAAAGGPEYLAALLDGIPAINARGIEGWQDIVLESSRKRAVLVATERMQALAKGEASAHDVLEEGMRLLQETAGRVGSSVDFDVVGQIKAAVRSLEAGARGEAVGWNMGLLALDCRVGPLPAGQLVIVAGRTGLGKSTLLANIGDAIASQGGPVLLFSAEMTATEINRRRLIAAAGVPASHFEPHGVTPSPRDWDAIARAVAALQARPFYVDASAPAPLEARAKARMLKARRGLAAVLFDYLQLMPAGPGRKGETREAEVARVSRALKRLAMDLDVVVIAASQLNRSAEQRKDGRPRMSDLRESGAQEQDADVVLLLHQDEGKDNEIEVDIAKHRNRPRSKTRLRFDGGLHRFDDSAAGLRSARGRGEE